MMDMGQIEQNIVNQAKRANAPIPDRIMNAPVLMQGLELYLNAFFELDSSRPVGLSLLPIPWGAIVDYCAVYGIDNEQREDMLYFIRKMDNAHLDRLNKKEAKK